MGRPAQREAQRVLCRPRGRRRRARAPGAELAPGWLLQARADWEVYLDWSLVSDRVLQRGYASLDDFAADAERCFEALRSQHEEGSLVHTEATELKARLRRLIDAQRGGGGGGARKKRRKL